MKKLIIAATIAASLFASQAMAAAHVIMDCEGMDVSIDLNMKNEATIKVGVHRYMNPMKSSIDKTDSGEKLFMRYASDENGDIASFVFTEDDLARRRVQLVRMNKDASNVRANWCRVIGGQTW